MEAPICVHISPVEVRRLPVVLSGEILVVSPLISILDRVPRDPNKYFDVGLSRLSLSNGEGHGVRRGGLTQAIQTANSTVLHQPSCKISTGMRVVPTDEKKDLLQVTAEKGPFLRTDMVHVGYNKRTRKSSSGHIVHRIAWEKWKIACTVEYISDLFCKKDVVFALTWAGQAGMFDGRPSKRSGLDWGTFTVEAGRSRKKVKTKRRTIVHAQNQTTAKNSKETDIRRA